MPLGDGRPMAALVVSMLVAVLAYPASAEGNAPAPAPAPAPGAGSPGPAPSTLAGKHKLRITSVTNALAAILDGVKAEEVTETATFETTKQLCENQTKALNAGYADAKKDLKDNEGKGDATSALIITLGIGIKKLKKDIGSQQDSLLKARTLDKKQVKEYKAELQEKSSSLHQLDKALKEITKVRKTGGFLQNGVVKKLQMNQPGESSYIYGVVNNLRVSIAAKKADLMKAEAKRADIFAQLEKVQTSSLSADQASLIAKTEKLSQMKVDTSSIKNALDQGTKKVPILLGRLTETAQSCQASARAWITKQADFAKEKAAIQQAIRFLQRTALEQIAVIDQPEPVAESGDSDWEQVFGSTSFLQVGFATTVEDTEADTSAVSGQDKESGQDKQIESFITDDSHRDAATGNGLKKAVKALIASHVDNQKSDDKEKKYCDTTKESLVQQNGTMARDVDDIAAKVEKSKVNTIIVQGKLDKLQKSMAKDTADQIIAADVRKKAEAVFKQSTKDRKMTVKLLAKAMTVLKSVYRSFVQTDGPINGQGAIALLMNIKDDILKEDRDAVAAEHASRLSFATETQDTKESLIAKYKELTQAKKLKSVLKVTLLDQQLTLAQSTDKLSANILELAALALKCDDLVKNYEKTTKARAFDKGQLLDVIDIIADSDIGTRTVLAQAEGGLPADALAEQDAEAVVGPN